MLGATAQANIGVALNRAALNDPVLNSQLHFLGAIWLGFGLFLVQCLKTPAYQGLLKGALWIVVLGGLGRLIAVAQSGLPVGILGQGFIVFAIAIEILIAPLLLLWGCRLGIWH